MKKWQRGWKWTTRGLAALIILTASVGFWLSTSTSGLKSLASAVSHISGGKLSLEGLDGALSGSITARTIRFASDDLIVLARDVQLNWQPEDCFGACDDYSIVGERSGNSFVAFFATKILARKPGTAFFAVFA